MDKLQCDICGHLVLRDEMFPFKLNLPTVKDDDKGTVSLNHITLCSECVYVIAKTLEKEIPNE